MHVAYKLFRNQPIISFCTLQYIRTEPSHQDRAEPRLGPRNISRTEPSLGSVLTIFQKLGSVLEKVLPSRTEPSRGSDFCQSCSGKPSDKLRRSLQHSNMLVMPFLPTWKLLMNPKFENPHSSPENYRNIARSSRNASSHSACALVPMQKMNRRCFLLSPTSLTLLDLGLVRSLTTKPIHIAMISLLSRMPWTRCMLTATSSNEPWTNWVMSNKQDL